MKKFIDIERIIDEKNPKAKKWIPKFLVRYLKRIFHQEEVNRIIEENKDIYDYEFCRDLVHRFNLQFSVTGIENIPKTGGVICVVNHPLGGFDALAMVNEITPYRADCKFIVNDVLMNIENIHGYMVGVNKHGSMTKESILKLNELFESDKAVFVFPAGLVSRRKKGVVMDSEWKKTFVARAKKYQRDVVPIHIDGGLSPFFYRLSNFRKRLGIKANLEMLYLANETFKLKNQKFNITIGEPINHTVFDKSKTDKEWAEEVKQIVYQLKS